MGKSKLRAQRWQLRILKALFKRSEVPTDEERNQVALETGLRRPWVDDWFDLQRSLSRNSTSANAVGSSVAISTPVAVSSMPNVGLGLGITSLPGGGESSDDAHIPTSTPNSSHSINSTQIAGLTIPTNTLHGLLIAMPGPSIETTQTATRSSSVQSLDSIDTASMRYPTQSPPLERVAAALPVTTSEPSNSVCVENPNLISGSFAPIAYHSFSAVLANAFPEFAHISQVSQVPTPALAQDSNRDIAIGSPLTTLQPRSTRVHQIPKPKCPISYTARLSDITAMSRCLGKAHEDEDNLSKGLRNDKTNTKNTDCSKGCLAVVDCAAGHDDITKETVQVRGDQMNELEHRVSFCNKPTDQTTLLKSAIKRSPSHRVLRSAKRLCQR